MTRDLKALEAQTASPAPFADLAARSGETVHTLRAICNDLRPPLLQHDLASALKALVEQLDAGTRACIRLEVSADNLRLPDDVAVAIFRITGPSLADSLLEH